MKTDPANSDYTMERGGTRNYEPWRDKERTVADAIAAREEEEKGNAMKVGAASACCGAGALAHVCWDAGEGFGRAGAEGAERMLPSRSMWDAGCQDSLVQLKPCRGQLAPMHSLRSAAGAGEPHAGQQARDGHHERAGRDAVPEQAPRARGHRRRVGRAAAQRRQRAGAPTTPHPAATALGRTRVVEPSHLRGFPCVGQSCCWACPALQAQVFVSYRSCMSSRFPPLFAGLLALSRPSSAPKARPACRAIAPEPYAQTCAQKMLAL